MRGEYQSSKCLKSGLNYRFYFLMKVVLIYLEQYMYNEFLNLF